MLQLATGTSKGEMKDRCLIQMKHNNYYKTEEREALRKQGLNEKTAASVLLKLFISGNE